MQKGKFFALDRKNLFIRTAAVLIPVAIGLLLSQRVSAQSTYVITDGSRVTVHTTRATDPEDILGEAGHALGAEDTYTTQPGDGVSQINVQRGQNLTVNYYGEILQVTSRGETVEELLTRLNLPWSHWDSISRPLDSMTYDGMELTVAHVIRQVQTYTAHISHETYYCNDPSLPEGTEKILTEGADGEVLCEAEVTYTNGIETNRRILSRQVVCQPVSRIIAVGCGEEKTEAVQQSPTATIGDSTITLPTGEVLTYTEKVKCLATAYHCEGYVGTTATGTRARVGAIAVDPEVFPYGTRFYIVTRDGEYIYGVATAEDCGDKRFIYGTRLDLYFDTKKECVQFGARMCDVYVLG